MALLYITPDNVLRFSDEVSNDFEVPNAGPADMVSVSPDSSEIWLLSHLADTDPGDKGGYLLKVATNGGAATDYTFSAFKKPGGKHFGASHLVAGKKGCYFLEEDGSVHFVDKSGNHTKLYDAGTASKMTKPPAGRYIAVVTDKFDIKKGGNIIKYFTEDNPTNLQSPRTEIVSEDIAGGGADNCILCRLTNGKNISWDMFMNTIGEMAFGLPHIYQLIEGTPSYSGITYQMHPGGGNKIGTLNIDPEWPTIIYTAKGAIHGYRAGSMQAGAFVGH